jgi:excinuclease ABC subunit C
MPALALPQCDLDWLRRRVSNFSEDRPGVYRMLGPNGRVLYVGKAKRLRARLLSYFRATFPDDKGARILHAATDIDWQYAASEFAALLEELRQIRRHRPPFNVRMNRNKKTVLIKVSGGHAPKILVGSRPGGEAVRHYGPFSSSARAREAIRVLNDLLGLRDCSMSLPIVFAEQGDLFGPPVRAACWRHGIGTCAGPCAGFVSEAAYGQRVGQAIDFLEGRSIAPMDRVISEMTEAGDRQDFERASRWRDRFDALEWLFAALSRARAAIEALTFVYVDPGTYGEDMAYVIRRGTVRAVAPAPTTPIEREAFRAVVNEHVGPEPDDGPLPPSAIDEMLLLMRWFNGRPAAMRRTVPLQDWLND